MATIDIQKFAQMVKNKRGTNNLRDIAIEIGEVSISTLSRIEQGKVPDLGTFLKICSWLGVSPNDFTEGFQVADQDHKESIFYHLKAERSLTPEVSDSLVKMIEMAYTNAELLIKTKNEKGV